MSASNIGRDTTMALRDYFRGRQGELLSLIRRLVESESPSGDVEGSRAVVALLFERLRELEGVAAVERIESKGCGEHLRARFFVDPKTEAQPLLLLGHTDTVHARGSIIERPFRAEGERLYGPGIFDMKANCALALEALRACAALSLSPRREVVLLLTCDEEIGSATGRALVEDETRRAACVLVLEPPASGGRVKTGRKGTGIFELEARGIAAHAGLEPEKGASAIHELARLVERLCALADPQRGTTINVGVIAGGTRGNVVAAQARAEIDVRFSTADEARRIEREFAHLSASDERVKLSLRGGINRPPLERTEQVLKLYAHARMVAASFDYELGEAQVGGASDGNFAAALGVPVLDGLGVDGDGAHAVHEHIMIDDIAPRGALLAGLLMTL